MRVSGARDSCRHVKIRGFNRASWRASPDRSLWAMLSRDRMRPCTFLGVDNCGDVDIRPGHMGLDKTRGERHDPRTLGVRPSTTVSIKLEDSWDTLAASTYAQP